eukprot:m51a1_g3021 hypothetical protein (191) ;mRNA; f:871751-872557
MADAVKKYYGVSATEFADEVYRTVGDYLYDTTDEIELTMFDDPSYAHRPDAVADCVEELLGLAQDKYDAKFKQLERVIKKEFLVVPHLPTPAEAADSTQASEDAARLTRAYEEAVQRALDTAALVRERRRRVERLRKLASATERAMLLAEEMAPAASAAQRAVDAAMELATECVRTSAAVDSDESAQTIS